MYVPPRSAFTPTVFFQNLSAPFLSLSLSQPYPGSRDCSDGHGVDIRERAGAVSPGFYFSFVPAHVTHRIGISTDTWLFVVLVCTAIPSKTILASDILFSTCSLRLHSHILCGTGPILVTIADAAMGHLHIHRQSLCRPLGTRAYRILLLFRPPALLNPGPTRPKV